MCKCDVSFKNNLRTEIKFMVPYPFWVTAQGSADESQCFQRHYKDSFVLHFAKGRSAYEKVSTRFLASIDNFDATSVSPWQWMVSPPLTPSPATLFASPCDSRPAFGELIKRYWNCFSKKSHWSLGSNCEHPWESGPCFRNCCSSNKKGRSPVLRRLAMEVEVRVMSRRKRWPGAM